jgi:hypothetical protein
MSPNVVLRLIVRCAKPRLLPPMRLSDNGMGTLCGTTAPVPGAAQSGAGAYPNGRGVAG